MANKKNTIRLSESQLHRVIMESVNRIINEAQLNELHPLTLDSYARGRDAQGQHEKARVGRNAAVGAWNKQFGDDNEFMSDGYQIRQNNWSKDKYGKHVNNKSQYNPYMDKSVESQTTYFRNGDTEETPEKISDGYYGDNHKGISVARQMANGNGQYVDGKGWQ